MAGRSPSSTLGRARRGRMAANRMIVRTQTGYAVVSGKGKFLSRQNLTQEQAEERLAQVEKYKAIGASRQKRENMERMVK